MDLTVLGGKFLACILSALGGIVLTVLTQRLLYKRAVFTYSVEHSRIAASTDDAALGSVRVLWNEKPVTNLYLSTIEIKNESQRDHVDVAVRVYASNTNLLTEFVWAVGTLQPLVWTKEFQSLTGVGTNSTPSEQQFALILAQREYLVPVMNRGQVVRLHLHPAAAAVVAELHKRLGGLDGRFTVN